MRRTFAVLLFISLALNATLALVIHQSRKEAVLREQGFLRISLDSLILFTEELKGQSTGATSNRYQLVFSLCHVLNSKDKNLNVFFTTVITAWSELSDSVSHTNRDQLVEITLAIHEAISPLWGGMSRTNATSEKQKLAAAQQLVARLKERELWVVLTKHRPSLEQLAELIDR